MKFDFVIGNPPYQEENDNNNRKKPVYHLFMDEAYKISSVVELITPARFLFDAGQTPKSWNQKMLEDEHFKVLLFEPDGGKIFSGIDIKGGVAISYRNKNEIYGKIGVFTSNEMLNKILQSVNPNIDNSLYTIAYPKSYFGFSENLYKDYPKLLNRLTEGNEYIVDASIFNKMPEVFEDVKSSNSVSVVGRENNVRIKKYIVKDYIKNVKGLDNYKVFIAGANGSGTFGEILSEPIVGEKNEICTQTFMTFGFFNSKVEAEYFVKYIKTKFARCMLGILKVTQNNPKDTWSKIPVQKFTAESDIDWSKSIKEIDKQLYKKYKLSKEEIEFIESKVKEME